MSKAVDTSDDVIVVSATAHQIIASAERYMHQAMPRFTAELRQLCNIASASDNPAGLKAMAAYLAKRYAGLGMRVEVIEDERGDAIVAELDGDNPIAQPILLLGHHDTVYSAGVTAPPDTIEGDKFFGPGVADMKGGLLQAIYMLEALQHAGYRDFSTIIFLSVPDEEIDFRYHTSVLRRITDAHQPLVLTLESARTLGNIVVGRKGVQRFKIVAKGVAAHAGAEFAKGRSAVLELAHQMVQFNTLPHLPEGMTINIGPFRGGTHPNVVADYAEAVIESRFMRPEDVEVIIERWNACMAQQLVEGVELSMELLPGRIPPMVLTERGRTIASQIEAALQELGHDFYAEVRGGSSDGGTASDLGLTALDGFGAVGHQGHSPEEYIDLSAVPAKVGLFAATITICSAAVAHAEVPIQQSQFTQEFVVA
jgi:glutamate carboxypeptidase